MQSAHRQHSLFAVYYRGYQIFSSIEWYMLKIFGHSCGGGCKTPHTTQTAWTDTIPTFQLYLLSRVFMGAQHDSPLDLITMDFVYMNQVLKIQDNLPLLIKGDRYC